MIAYKVVSIDTIDRKTLRSGFYVRNDFSYEVGKVVNPITESSRLFAFDNKENAFNWRRNRDWLTNPHTTNKYGFFKVFEAEVEGVEDNPFDFFAGGWKSDIHRFINGDIKDVNRMEEFLLPTGTLAVKSIKLIKEVEL